MNHKDKVLIQNSEFTREGFFQNKKFKLTHINCKESKILKIEEFTIGFIQKGKLKLASDDFQCVLQSGMFFAIPAQSNLEIDEHSNIALISNQEMNYLRFIGGPIEKVGRLKYIDGCSDSIIVYPPKLGYPCLNHLHFPMETNQTSHYHPSFRFGLVYDGKGYCESGGEMIELLPGDCFYIPENVEHKFKTHEQYLNIIAFHPETDWGPTDQDHPMINKTLFK